VNLQVKVALAFLAVYTIWGSTYLAIRFVIETVPPFFMAGTRFLIAGAFLYVWAAMRGASRASFLHWRSAFVIGGFMLLGGHGAVIWAEQWVPSGLVSLLISTVPLWMVLLDWRQLGARPSAVVVGGLLLGFLGIGLLVVSTEGFGKSYVDPVGAVIVVSGAFLWAFGSLYSRSTQLPSSPMLAIGMEMIAGGVLLLFASLLTGEWTRINLSQVSLRSMLSWVYLIVFGSLIGFTSYIWLLKTTTTARVSTYAYVNPIVAMFLGWALADEPNINAKNLIAAAIILAAVVLITTRQSTEKTRAR
jgi:drug/metabolite transporter (DMT)-like permease